MGITESVLCRFTPNLAEARTVTTGADFSARALQMVETVGAPGQIPAGPLPQLVISQALGDSFHYHCDLGGGRFSGQGVPMDFVLIAPNAQAWCQIDQPHRLRFLGIPTELAQQLLGRDARDMLDFGALCSQQHRDPFIAQTLETLWQEFSLGEQRSRLFLETAVTGLLLRLQRLADQQAPQLPPRGGLTAWQSARVIDYMRTQLSTPITLAELAALVALSPWHFARAFRDTHGMPPHRYLTHLRVEKARDLLLHSPCNITEIAALTGYSSQHLARHFRREYGCSPSQYRRQQFH